jgi:hypothetical protein
MRLAFAIAIGCADATACCLQVADSGLIGTGSDGGGVHASLVWPPSTGAIAAGDVNQDGIQDLALLVSGYDAGGIYLYYGLQDGGLSQGPIVGLPSSSSLEWDHLVVFDLNGDGWPDLIASGQYEIGVSMNQRDGGFVVYSQSQANHLITWVQAADFDGSGRGDLVVGGYGGVVLFLDEGDVPSFATPITLPIPLQTNLQELDDVVPGLGVGDVDGDGKMDIVSYEADDRGDEYLIVRRGLGDGGFLAPEVYPSAPGTPSANGIYGPILVADVNGDGIPDVAAGTYSGFALRLSLGGGRLGNEIDIAGSPPAQFGTTTIVAIDSLDGGNEVVTGGSWTCGSSTGQLPVSRLPMVFPNDGGGNFLAGAPFSVRQANPGPVATWLPAGADRPVLVVGDLCAPNVSFISE